jgi:hypothetical protein
VTIRHALIIALGIAGWLTACGGAAPAVAPAEALAPTATREASPDAGDALPTATPVAAAEPTPADPAGAATPTEGYTFVALDGVADQFVAFPTGMLDDADARHDLTVQQRTGGGYAELARITLPNTRYLDPASVRQVTIAPDRLWLAVASRGDAELDCFDLVTFDGTALATAFSTCSDTPGQVQLQDLDLDGATELIIDRTDHIAWCDRCGVVAWDLRVMYWDGAALREVALTPAGGDSAAAFRTNAALERAQAGRWIDTLAIIAGDAPDPAPTPEPAVDWLFTTLRLTAERRAEQAQSGTYPLLDRVFFGDYAGAIDVMRPYVPLQLIDWAGPLFLETPFLDDPARVAAAVLEQTGRTLAAQPDDDAALFLRGWARLINDSGDQAGIDDIARAAELVPDDALYAAMRDTLPLP